MATSIDELQIQIQGTASGANRSINTLIKNLNRLQTSISSLDASKLGTFSANSTKASNSSKQLSTSLNLLSSSSTRSTKSFNGLASAFGRFYANYFLVVRGIKGLWSSIKKTSDYIEAFNYYTVAFGKVASEWDKDWDKYGSENAKNYSNAFVTSMNETLGKLSGVKLAVDEKGQGFLSGTGAKNLGLNIKEITQYASQLASVTNSLGQTGETTLAVSSSFTKLAGDISSLFNVDYSTGAQNLQSGLIGQSRALYKYGIDITNATLQTYAYELGLEKAVSEMTQMEKQQLRVLAILDQSEVAFGDLANTINSPSNMIRQLTNNLEEASIILGQLFMPVVENVLPMINGLSIAVKQLLSDIAGFMGITIDLESAGQGFSDTEEGLDGITDGLDEATNSANELKKSLRGFDKLNVISISSGTSSSGLLGAIDLTEQIVKATEEYEAKWNEAFENMENKAEGFAKRISSALEPVKKIIQDFAIGDYFQAGQDISNLVVSINEFLSEAIESVDWVQVGNNFGNFLARIEWKEVIRSGFELAFDIGEAIAQVWFESFETAPIETAILSALALMNLLPHGTLIATKVATETATSMKTKPIADLFSAGIEALAGSEAAKSAIVFMANSLAQTFMNTFLPATLGTLSAWFEYRSETEEYEIRDKVAEYQHQGMTHEEARDLAVSESGDKFFDKVGMYKYDTEKAQHDVLVEQANMLRDFGQGFVDLFDQIGDNIWNAFKSGWNPVSGYATGGVNIPEDGWFRASKGEYFGHFDDGTSVIANNNQIISGIANGVKDANSEQNALLREQNALLRQILAKDTGISSRDVFNAVRTESNNYTRRTGQPAFGY